jgi:hypothetical protein
MISYSKAGQNFILMSNTNRGVMKFSADGLEKFDAITARIPDKAGVPYETVASLTNVVQLDKFDAQRAVVVTRTGTNLDLKTVALP